MRVILVLQILNVSSQTKKGHATLLPKQQCVRVTLAQRVMQIFSVQQKQRAHVEEKIVIPAKAPQYSAVNFSVIFALLGEQFRVPTFRLSEIVWAASSCCRRGGDTSGVCSTPPFIISRLRARASASDLDWAVAPAVLPSSWGKRTPSKAPVLHDARAQPCVDCIVPLGAPDALLPSHL